MKRSPDTSALTADNSSVSQTIRQLRNHPLGCAPSRPVSPSLQDAESDLFQIASQVLNNPLAQRRLGERILEIMRLDIQHQRERDGNRP